MHCDLCLKHVFIEATSRRSEKYLRKFFYILAKIDNFVVKTLKKQSRKQNGHLVKNLDQIYEKISKRAKLNATLINAVEIKMAHPFFSEHQSGKNIV